MVAVVLAGLGVLVYTSTREPERGLTDAELRWVEKYVQWREPRWTAVDAAVEALGTSSSRAAELALLTPLRACTRSYERRTGPAPERLERLEDGARDACEGAQFAIGELDTFGDTALGSARRTLRDASYAFSQSDARLSEHLLLTRPLPTTDSVAESRIDPRLSAAASRVSSVPMEVRCWSRAEWAEVHREIGALLPEETNREYDGAGGVWGGVPSLSSRVCEPLVGIADRSSRERPTSKLAFAFRVLGHEIVHAAGTEDEAETDCRGIQNVRRLATSLGAPARVAEDLAARAWKAFQENETLNPAYWSPACRDGGPWDEHESAVWP